MHSDQFKPKSYLKLNKKYVFSGSEQFPLNVLCLVLARHNGIGKGAGTTFRRGRRHTIIDQPRAPSNPVFSPVLGHLFFTPGFFNKKMKAFGNK